ncbi:MAG: TolC family protein [Alphaproteobacteria bacterium]|nr:TolC family protein [Alphaproteobacteria bacterium]
MVLFNRKNLSLAFLLLSWEARAVTLVEAISNAYQHNPKMKINQEEYITTVQKFPETLSANFLPDIHYVNQSTRSSGKLRQATPRDPVVQNTFSRGVQIKQNLFAGGAGFAALSAAKNQVDAAKLKYLDSEQQFFLEGIKLYTGYIAAKEKLDASMSYVVSTQKRHEAELEKMKVGQSTSTEVAAAKAEFSKALYENAKNTSNFFTSTSAFRAFFDLDPQEAKLPELPSDLPTEYEIFKKEATSANLPLRFYRSTMKAQRNSVTAAQGRLLPSVNLTAANMDNTSPVNSFGINSQKTKNSSVSITLDIPILASGGAEYSRVRSEKSRLRSAVHSLNNINNTIEATFISHWEEFKTSKAALKYAQEEVEARSLAYEGMKSSFDVGLSSLLEVLDSEKNLYQSKSQLIDQTQSAIISAYTIKSDLARLTAKTMGLKVKIFDPDLEFSNTRVRIIGF